MARFAGVALFLAAGALGYCAMHLGLTLTSADLRVAAPLSIEAELAVAEQVEPETGPGEWPALFGVFEPEAQVVDTAPRPSENYKLVGLVAGGQRGWAIITSSEGDTLVRIGDTLTGGETVSGIDGNGVWIERDGTKEVVGFAETSADALARLALSSPGVPKEANVPISAFDGRDMRRVLGRAGSVRMVDPGGSDGNKFPEIVWVREGQLYDLIGLRRGDIVLRVNDHSVGDPETLVNAKSILGSADEFAVEILRGGQRQTIKVRISGRG